jgi:hypothetical protein
MQIDESDSHTQNACFSIRDSLEPDSNVIIARTPLLEKQDSQIVSTEDGMQIDVSDVHNLNASFSIRESLEPDSNVTVKMPLH